jgi:hypothetical protein
MDRRKRFVQKRICGRLRMAPGLGLPFIFRLRRVHVLGDGQQDVMRMVPKLSNRHRRRWRHQRAGKRFPLDQDRLDVVFDELAQAHA